MINILKNQNGMNIVGQGGKIILFMLPSLIAAIWVQTNFRQIATLPESIRFIGGLGYLLLIPGLILWSAAVIQLMKDFPKGKLVTTGAYRIVRNPIYSSVTFFILPAVALLTLTWMYFVPSVFLYFGVMIFIGKEEMQLAKAFGKEYEDYKTKVDRMVPFKKPDSKHITPDAGTGKQETKTVRKILLISGILSSVLYVGTDIFAASQWEGYSPVSQTVSELIAINAPTRPFVVPLFIVYSLLVYIFGLGIWRSAGQKRALRVVAVLVIGKEVLGLVVTLFAPIHLRGFEVTLTDTMHGIITALGVFLCMLPAIGFGATAFGIYFRFYSILTMVIFIVFGVLTGLDGPRLAANLPTPWMGLWERINIFGYMLWIVVLATILLRTENGTGSIKRSDA